LLAPILRRQPLIYRALLLAHAYLARLGKAHDDALWVLNSRLDHAEATPSRFARVVRNDPCRYIVVVDWHSEVPHHVRAEVIRLDDVAVIVMVAP